MTYTIKAQIYAQSIQNPNDLESKDFWEKIDLLFTKPHSKQIKHKVKDFLAVRGNAVSELRNTYSDEAGNPQVVELEFDIQPEFLLGLEKAGLKLGTGGDIEVSIYAISDLGITLFLEYYPYVEEKELLVFNGNMFIPFHRLVSINALYSEAIDSIYVNKAILKGSVENIEKEE